MTRILDHIIYFQNEAATTIIKEKAIGIEIKTACIAYSQYLMNHGSGLHQWCLLLFYHTCSSQHLLFFTEHKDQNDDDITADNDHKVMFTVFVM